MAPHALLPGCFTPEEAREIERRKSKAEHDRLIASLRPPPRSRHARRDRSEALAEEAAKREWIEEQKLLIAAAMRRSGGRPDPRWNDEGRDRRRMRAKAEELSAAFEVKKRQWMITSKPSIVEDAETESVSEERDRAEPDDGAKIQRTVPEKSPIEKHLWGARRRNDEYYAIRRQVLGSFQFVTDKECEGEKLACDEEEEGPVLFFCHRLCSPAAGKRQRFAALA